MRGRFLSPAPFVTESELKVLAQDMHTTARLQNPGGTSDLPTNSRPLIERIARVVGIRLFHVNVLATVNLNSTKRVLTNDGRKASLEYRGSGKAYLSHVR